MQSSSLIVSPHGVILITHSAMGSPKALHPSTTTPPPEVPLNQPSFLKRLTKGADVIEGVFGNSYESHEL